jgi:hypothetical protein
MRESGIIRKLLLHASMKMPEVEAPLVIVDFKTVEPIVFILTLGILVAPALLVFELILHRVSEIKFKKLK